MRVIKKLILTAFLVGILTPTMPLNAAFPSGRGYVPPSHVETSTERQARHNEELLSEVNHGRLEKVRRLLTVRANPDAIDTLDNSALMIAVRQGHAEIMRLLIQAGASFDYQTMSGRTALISAAQFGHIETVKVLIQAGADVNKTLRRGDTALIMAVMNKRTEIVKALIQARASLDLQNGQGETKLMIAARYKSTNTVRELIHACANLNIVTNDKNPNTALTYALKSSMSSHIKINTMQTLIDAGAKLDIQKPNYRSTALIEAVLSDNASFKMVQALLHAGVDINVCHWNRENNSAETAQEAAKKLHKMDIYDAIEQEIERRNGERVKRKILTANGQSRRYLQSGPLSVAALCNIFTEYALPSDPMVEDRRLFEDAREQERMQRMQELATARPRAIEIVEEKQLELSEQTEKKIDPKKTATCECCVIA
jgi:ankyrin repeat protein